MKAVRFPQADCVIGKGQPEYRALPAKYEEAEHGRVTMCFELDPEEAGRLIRNEWRIWVQLLTFGHPMQPILITTDPPEHLAQTGPVKNPETKPKR